MKRLAPIRTFHYAAWRLHLVRFAARVVEPKGRNERGYCGAHQCSNPRSFRSCESTTRRKVVRHPTERR